MKTWSLSKKIWGVLFVLCVAYVGSNGYTLLELLRLKDDLNDITGNIVRRDQLTSEIKDNQRRLSVFTLESILQTDPAKLEKVSKNFDDIVQKQEKDMGDYEALASEKGKGILTKYKTAYYSYLATAKKARAHGMENKHKEATDEIFSAEEHLVGMRTYIEELNKLTADQLAAKSEASNAAANKAVVVAIASAIVSIFMALIIAFFTLRSLTRAISDVVKNLSDSSAQVSGAATQIASSSEELSQASTEQAASLEETAASVEEMNSMINKNSENANSAAATSGQSQESVNQGKVVIKKMIESMEAINKSSEGMADTVKVIEQIDKKTKVINEIVNKTELLSFNASVEAARAGEHGKGFAVVAEEVGNLARMSGAAAEEIAALLEESISKVNQMVADTKRNVSIGAEVTKECGDVFEDVVKNVNSVSTMASEIASASQEQARGVTEITKAMNQLDQMTQQNAATSEECASAAEELSAQADALKNAVSMLVVTVNGGDRSEHHMRAAMAPVMAPRATRSSAKPMSNKVIQLKNQKPSLADANFKKAAGDTPSYDSDGFKDI